MYLVSPLRSPPSPPRLAAGVAALAALLIPAVLALLAIGAAGCTHPADYDTALAEAKAVFEAGDHERAYELFDDLRRRFPDRWEPYSYLAWTASELGQPERAVPAFEQRLARGGDNLAVVHDVLATLLEQADRWEEAQQHFREALRLDPGSQPTYLKLSRLLARSGDYPAALELAREGVTRFPDDPALRAWLGEALLKSRHFAQAEEQLRAALTLPGAGGYTHYNLGLVYLLTGRLEAARGELEAAVELQPAAHEGWYQLANVYEQLGELEARDRALAQFEVALRRRVAAGEGS